jgi:hypothetical protein
VKPLAYAKTERLRRVKAMTKLLLENNYLGLCPMRIFYRIIILFVAKLKGGPVLCAGEAPPIIALRFGSGFIAASPSKGT